MQHYSTTTLQHYQHYSTKTVQHYQHYSSKTLQHYNTTAQYYITTTLQHYNTTALPTLQHNTTALQHYSTTLQHYQHYSTTTLQHYQHYSTTTLHHYQHYITTNTTALNTTALQHYSTKTLQHYNTKTLQHYQHYNTTNTTALQHYSTTNHTTVERWNVWGKLQNICRLAVREVRQDILNQIQRHSQFWYSSTRITTSGYSSMSTTERTGQDYRRLLRSVNRQAKWKQENRETDCCTVTVRPERAGRPTDRQVQVLQKHDDDDQSVAWKQSLTACLLDRRFLICCDKTSYQTDSSKLNCRPT